MSPLQTFRPALECKDPYHSTKFVLQIHRFLGTYICTSLQPIDLLQRFFFVNAMSLAGYANATQAHSCGLKSALYHTADVMVVAVLDITTFVVWVRCGSPSMTMEQVSCLAN